MPDQPIDEATLRRKYAVELFNRTWDLLDKADRTPEEADEMVHAAHASRHHWGQIGTPLEFERGEWQISRVYATLGRAEPALYHAHRCIEICQDNNIADFDIAFAYEALARAHTIAGQSDKGREYLDLGRKAAEGIADDGDRQYTLGELKSVSALLD